MIAQNHPVHPARVSRSEPRLVGRSAFLVAGLRYIGRNTEGEVAELWREFESRLGAFAAPPGIRLLRFGVLRRLNRSSIEAGHEYLAGVELQPGVRVPPDLTQWAVPAGSYAVTTAHGLDDVRPATAYFYHHWLPDQDELKAVEGPTLELFPSTYPESPTLLLHFPVEATGR